jgi:hypothetical protein
MDLGSSGGKNSGDPIKGLIFRRDFEVDNFLLVDNRNLLNILGWLQI